MAAISRLTQALQRFSPNGKADRRDAGRPRTPRGNDLQQIAAEAERWQREIAEARVAMSEVERGRHRDSLTGLYNRSYLALLTAKLDEWRSRHAGTPPLELCVICVDLDDFEPVNDALGHAAGDEVLRQVAGRLCRVAREKCDVVLRLGGDEFLLLLPCPVGRAADVAPSIAARVVAALQPPITWLTTVELRLGASIGAAVWRPGRGSLSSVIAQADEALYAAKRAGRGRFRQYAVGPAAARGRVIASTILPAAAGAQVEPRVEAQAAELTETAPPLHAA